MNRETPSQEPEAVSPQAIGADLLLPTAAAALAAYYIGTTGDLAWEARATGWLVGGVLLALCFVKTIALIVRFARGRIDGGFAGLFAADALNRRRVALMATLVCFVVTLPWLGTTLGLFLTLAVGMMILGVREWRTILAIAGATATTVFLLFILALGSRLPRGALDEWLFALVRWGA